MMKVNPTAGVEAQDPVRAEVEDRDNTLLLGALTMSVGYFFSNRGTFVIWRH